MKADMTADIMGTPLYYEKAPSPVMEAYIAGLEDGLSIVVANRDSIDTAIEVLKAAIDSTRGK